MIASRALLPWIQGRHPIALRILRMSRASNHRVLRFSDGPLVWVDCEMTGLDLQSDRLLEIAVLITDGNLELVDEGISYAIKTEKHILDEMNEWCRYHHGKSGLTQACIDSPYSHEFVKSAVLSYIQEWIPDKSVGVLAGNSVHVDRTFLAKHMSDITDFLHYRIVDVSSIKELVRRWYRNDPVPKPLANHRALDDIKNSIRELKWYREKFFVQPSIPQGPPPMSAE